MFPFIMLVVTRIDRLMKTFASLIIIIFVAAFGLWIWGNTFGPGTPYELYYSPYERLIDFIVGICLYFIVKNIETKTNRQRIVWTGIEIAAIGIIIAAQWSTYAIPMKYLYDVYFIIPWTIIVGVFALSRGFISRLLSWKPLVVSGSISLEFFLIHNFALRWIYSYVSPTYPMTQLQMLAASFVTSVLASILIHSILTGFPRLLFRSPTVIKK